MLIVGLDEGTIAKCIRKQEALHIELEELSVKEREDLFEKRYPFRTPFGERIPVNTKAASSGCGEEIGRWSRSPWASACR